VSDFLFCAWVLVALLVATMGKWFTAAWCALWIAALLAPRRDS
jgi:hypothetical protein